MTLDSTDSIKFIGGMNAKDEFVVGLRNGAVRIPEEDIPDATKKSKGKKLVNPSGNINIVTAVVNSR